MWILITLSHNIQAFCLWYSIGNASVDVAAVFTMNSHEISAIKKFLARRCKYSVVHSNEKWDCDQIQSGGRHRRKMEQDLSKVPVVSPTSMPHHELLLPPPVVVSIPHFVQLKTSHIRILDVVTSFLHWVKSSYKNVTPWAGGMTPVIEGLPSTRWDQTPVLPPPTEKKCHHFR
jgi:hypothetical protein